jgi:glycoprotein-N-acetylgalactosamine 3-beta-galactosyltransferase
MNRTLYHIKDLPHVFPILELHDLKTDSYHDLGCKMYHAIRDIYIQEPNYDWYLKADEDTFIFVDHLREFLVKQNSSEPVTFGYNFKPLVEKGYHSGGAGYVMSGEAFRRIGEKLNEDVNFCQGCGVEDLNVAKCLRKLNVYPGSSIDEEGRERFHPLSVSNHIQGGYPDWFYKYAQNKPLPVLLLLFYIEKYIIH